ncbi:beta-amylase 2, chloroplastic isoform X2 [Pyrus communis]|uniref:beta-amylase 2, chloroplastic isoform X2 n=1 Tax=Pyrus communis TaxID=23211 RepID=UPI0035BF27EB
MAQFSSPQVSHKLRLPRPPGACCKATTMASLSSSGKTAIASLKLSQGLWGSPELNLCPLRLLGSDPSRSFSVVRDSAEGTVVGENVDHNKVEDSSPENFEERDFTGTPYVPVYVMLPLGVINMNSKLVEPEALRNQLQVLKSVGVDGVMVDCWWGIVEAHSPQGYNWSGYKKLFQIVRDLNLKLQVVMSFHECGGNVGDDVHVPLPHWVTEIGQKNPDIYFTNKEGKRNTECLTWGIDKERVLRGRTAVEVYFDYMRSFRVEFDEFFEEGIISEIEVGLGPCGELRYPSYPEQHGWKYPGIGEFQCYDRYLMKNLTQAAEARGHSFWARVPDNAGSYNSQPHETGFFRDGGDYDSYYGRFFLNWYSRVLIDHGDRVLALANLAFEGTRIATKVLNAAWDANIPVASENALTCFDREGYNKILENAKPWNDPDGRHLSAFTYLRLSPVLIEKHNLTEFERFVKRMHGEAAPDV